MLPWRQARGLVIEGIERAKKAKTDAKAGS
jgi:hypothetical protein